MALSRAAFAALSLLLLVFPAAAQAAVPDPAAPGPLAVTRIDYEDGVEVVGQEGGTQYTEEIRGSIHVPDNADGPFPIAVLLHGRHATCSAFEVESLGSPCPGTPFTNSIDSYKGYDYIAQNLASHGYVVMSVNANGVNTYDTSNLDAGANARSEVLAHSLDRLAEWNEQSGPGAVDDKLLGKLDFSRIGMMGHSRGGEGVTDFIAYNRTRTDGPRYPGLKAVFSLAPIDAKAQDPQGVAFSTLLPYCDGDVSPLNGSRPFERSKYDETDASNPRIQWGVNGANHNFFNTIWVDDDNSTETDDACAASKQGSQRLSETDERRVGLGLIAPFLRRYVGPEPAFDPLMTGAEPLPASACPGGVGGCDELVQTSYIGASTTRRVVLEPGAEATLTEAADGGAITASGFAQYSTCTPSTAANECPTPRNRSLARQLTLAWDGPATLRVALAGASTDASAFRALTLRAAANYGDTQRNPAGVTQDFDVTLEDVAGRRATVPAAELARGALVPSAGSQVAPGSSGDQREVVLGGIRIPLERFTGVDLGRLAALELGFGSRTQRGSIQLADVLYQEPGERPPAATQPDEPAPGAQPNPGGQRTLDGELAPGARAESRCSDRIPPRGRVLRRRGVRLGARRLVLRGRAGDRGCVTGGSRVRLVRVAVLRAVGGGRCRYLGRDGRLGPRRSCRRPVFLFARGTSSWRLALTGRPPRGRYVVLVRAKDRAGNQQRPSARRLIRVGRPR